MSGYTARPRPPSWMQGSAGGVHVAQVSIAEGGTRGRVSVPKPPKGLVKRRKKRTVERDAAAWGAPVEPTTRCWTGVAQGRRCALDRGHYREPTDPRGGSPHVAEDGTRWYGLRVPGVPLDGEE